ncbi:hypothetical protein [Burkholderia ubonensis]|uniref:hypothetical protein n=1 Tax=Burkholderia ubonensis TaxID=101571 RepID=UPI000AA8F6A8|nr:hypothetical protein [Burkholderia ubonensis]
MSESISSIVARQIIGNLPGSVHQYFQLEGEASGAAWIIEANGSRLMLVLCPCGPEFVPNVGFHLDHDRCITQFEFAVYLRGKFGIGMMAEPINRSAVTFSQIICEYLSRKGL